MAGFGMCLLSWTEKRGEDSAAEIPSSAEKKFEPYPYRGRVICRIDPPRDNFALPAGRVPGRAVRRDIYEPLYRHIRYLRDRAEPGRDGGSVERIWSGCAFVPDPAGGTGLYLTYYPGFSSGAAPDRAF